jgi:hypothetical protein
MIFIVIAVGFLCLWLGYDWGHRVGQTEIERKIINHVIHSPEYGDQILKSIKFVLRKVKR